MKQKADSLFEGSMQPFGINKNMYCIYIYMPVTPRPTSSLWLFQSDDSTSLHGKWLEIAKHPLKTGCLEFQVYIYIYRKAEVKS